MTKNQTGSKRTKANAAGTANEQTKKKKRRRAIVKEPGPEPGKLQLKGAKGQTKQKVKPEVKSERKRPSLSPEALRARDEARRLFKDQMGSGSRGSETEDDFGGGSVGLFRSSHSDDIGRARKGGRITGYSF